MIRALVAADLDALIALRREALTRVPLAFGASPGDDRLLAPGFAADNLGAPEEAAVFGAFAGDALVGMVGIRRMEKLKARHRAVLWGMYVTPSARGTGVGASLLAAAIGWARARAGLSQVELSVTDAAPEALRLYERSGFRRWGHQPRSIVWEGRDVDEHHMTLRL